MRELKQRFKTAIILLMKLKINGERADDVFRRLGMDRWIRLESVGFSGGVWCLWDDNEIEVTLRYANAFFLHVSVTAKGAT